MRTPYIVIDGPDGCGKTTQVGLLKERALHEGRDCLFTREPGSTPFSSEIRALFLSDKGANTSAVTQFQIMWGARRDHLEKVVWPALESGTPVVSDRGDSSTLAYQVYADNVLFLENEFWRIRKLVFAGREPDLYIYIDIPAVLASCRVKKDSSREKLSHFDAKPLSFYINVVKGFTVFGNEPVIKMVTINGIGSPHEVHEEIYKIVSEKCRW